jgi:PhzF family phenazine biosynthesis protein
MSLPIYQIDAFVTDRKFSGNPAGVCLLPDSRDEHWMQNVAMEMNLAETAFLRKRPDGYDLRWFTPTVEVALCGHATLASAHMLWETGELKPEEQARFHTKSGVLTADRKGNLIELDFPATPDTPATPPADLLPGLGITAKYVGKSQFDYIVEVDSEQIVLGLKPDFTALKKITVRGIIVTSRSSSPQYDFISRFFAPGSGIDEDPVTGSAHSCLGPFWQSRLHKNNFVAYQASPRGGVVHVRLEGDRVKLAGKALTMLRGELL